MVGGALCRGHCWHALHVMQILHNCNYLLHCPSYAQLFTVLFAHALGGPAQNKGKIMQKAINRADYSFDGILDSVIDLLVQSRLNDQDIYLVYSESDPDLTVELDDGSFIIRIKGVPVAYDDAIIERMFGILSAPIHDYK
jgi:hypothetical protein